MKTNLDCLFEGDNFDTTMWNKFTSSQLASIVGDQHPNGYLEDLKGFNWQFTSIKTEKLNLATEYGEAPDGGWKQLYLKFLEEDILAAIHTPEYAGRDTWLKNEWISCTKTYPLFVLYQENEYRILDGYHRLAGAFYYGLKSVSIILGTKNSDQF